MSPGGRTARLIRLQSNQLYQNIFRALLMTPTRTRGRVVVLCEMPRAILTRLLGTIYSLFPRQTNSYFILLRRTSAQKHTNTAAYIHTCAFSQSVTKLADHIHNRTIVVIRSISFRKNILSSLVINIGVWITVL